MAEDKVLCKRSPNSSRRSRWGAGDNMEQDLYELAWWLNHLVASAMEVSMRDAEPLKWLCKLKDAAFDLEDLLDDLNSNSQEELRRWRRSEQGNASAGGGIRRKVRDLLFLSPKSKKYTMVRRICNISTRFDEISESSPEGGIDASVSERQQYIEPTCMSSSVIASSEEEVYGREAEKEDVIHLLLLLPTLSDENLPVLPIVGMGGIGKTTLTQIVYNDPRIRAHFDLQLWVRVGQVFDVQDIGEALLEDVTGERCKNPSTDFILHFLDLSNTQVEVLPESIDTLYNLQTLRLASCAKLQKLPLAIGNLENLRLLDLSHSSLQSLPESVTALCSLRVFNLSSCSKLQKLPLAIGALRNLRLLDLSWSHIQSLPESIADLTNLQILNLKNCREIRELPEGVQNMTNLNHLDIAGCQLTCMPYGLGRLQSLQTLPLFVIGNKAGHKIMELQHLNRIRGVLKITCLGNVKHPEEAKMANLGVKESLHSLELWWRTEWTRKWGEVDLVAIPPPSNENLDMDIFENLQPHESLRHLSVEDYRGSKFPTWLSKINGSSSLPKLESFSLYNLERCEHLPPLGRLPSLKHLKIESMYAVERMDTLGGTFLSLKYLKLWNLPSLKEWFVPEESFPSLETLIMVGCPKLKIRSRLPSSLLELEMESVNKEILVGGCLLGSSRLRKLKIAHFEASESWWEGMQFLTSLENLEIMNCFQTSLPDRIMQQHFPSLWILKLALNNDLKSIGVEEGEEPPLFFSELRHLSIQGCDELTELPEWLCKLDFLQSLELSYCDNLEMIPDKLLMDLAQLTISGCPKLEV